MCSVMLPVFDYVQLPGVKAKVFSEEYSLKEVGTFLSSTIDEE